MLQKIMSRGAAVVLLAIASGGMARPASAVNISYKTTGEFFVGGVSQGSSVTVDGAKSGERFTISYTGQSLTSFLDVKPKGVDGDLGKFVVTGKSKSTVSLKSEDIDFVLKIQQINPVSGIGTIAAEVTGKLKSSGSSKDGLLTFAATSVKIVGGGYQVVYDILNKDGPKGVAAVKLDAPGSSSTTTSVIKGHIGISSSVGLSAVPEPASLAMCGMGLLGVSAISLGRRRPRIASDVAVNQTAE